jgi:hypothetical protein
MNTNEQNSLNAIHDIRRIINKSGRFLSLSGYSGIAAGLCALIGCWFVKPYINGEKDFIVNQKLGLMQLMANDYLIIFNTYIFYIGLATLLAALFFAFIFTFYKSKKDGEKIFSSISIRLAFNLFMPLLVGFLFIVKLISINALAMVMPSLLIFYGLALVNASKFTLGEIKFLGYLQIILGLANMLVVGKGLYFAAAGFGVAHVLYGIIMWYKYDRVTNTN